VINLITRVLDPVVLVQNDPLSEIQTSMGVLRRPFEGLDSHSRHKINVGTWRSILSISIMKSLPFQLLLTLVSNSVSVPELKVQLFCWPFGEHDAVPSTLLKLQLMCVTLFRHRYTLCFSVSFPSIFWHKHASQSR
jgi:hypothetical protein